MALVSAAHGQGKRAPATHVRWTVLSEATAVSCLYFVVWFARDVLFDGGIVCRRSDRADVLEWSSWARVRL